MKTKIVWSVMVSAGLALSACGTKEDDPMATTTVNPADDGDDTTTGPVITTGMSSNNDTNPQQESGGSDSGGSDGADAADTMMFIENPDGGGVSFECDLFAQDCPDGEKCMPWANNGGTAWNATRCSMIADNPGQPGDECTVEGTGVSGIDDCDIGVMCWDVDPKTNVGTCVAMCTGDESNPICEDPDTTCAIANDGAIILCLPNCDPLLQDCADGQACYPINEAWSCAPDASGPDQGLYGDACEYLNACDVGLACLNTKAVGDICDPASGGCCGVVCDITAPNMCPGMAAGQVCETWYPEGMIPPGYENVGVCVLPA
jgi:hypothetical protein